MYQAGFFPVMMFGLPAGALALYHTAKDNKKKVAAGLLGAAALSAFFTGVPEPLEFAFMFLAPGLYVVPVSYTHLDVYKRQAKSFGEEQISDDPEISEWGNPAEQPSVILTRIHNVCLLYTSRCV